MEAEKQLGECQNRNPVEEHNYVSVAGGALCNKCSKVIVIQTGY